MTTLVANPDFSQVIIRTKDDTEHTLEREVTHTALLSQIKGKTTVVLPQRGRSQ